MFARGDDLQIPQAWINSALAGLERVNPFILELENMNAYDGDEDIALHLQYSDANPSAEIAAIISLAPAALPTRRKLVIRKKGADTPIFLDLFSPFVEPLHYLLLLPHGTLGWSPNRLNAAGNKFSQARWHRSRFFLNAEQMSIFSRLTASTGSSSPLPMYSSSSVPLCWFRRIYVRRASSIALQASTKYSP
jgi:hypothetical protein